MPVPTSLNDLSTTPASNFPAGSESPSVLDDTLRAHAALMATLRDQKLNASSVSAFGLTLVDDADAAAARATLGAASIGTAETITGVKTFSQTILGSVNGNAGTVTNGVYTTGDQAIAGDKSFSGSVHVANRITMPVNGANFEMGAGSYSGDMSKLGFGVPTGRSLYLFGNGSASVIEIGTTGVTFPTGVTLPTAAVGIGVAGLGAGSVGSYALVRKPSAGNLGPGDNVAGSSLEYSTADGGSGVTISVGTWRTMGLLVGAGSAGFSVTLALRIA